MAKNKQRNELSIFEDFRLKPAKDIFWSSEDPAEAKPREDDLKKIDYIYYYFNEKFKKNTYWIITKSGRISQVNEYGEPVFSSNDEYQKNIPKKSTLKKFKTDVRIFRDKHIRDLISWWVKDKNGELIQVNTKDEEVGVEFKIKSWLRNEAIDVVGLEIRSMKKKAYEYSEDELEKMIIEQENIIIKKKGWKAVRMVALSSLGLGFLPFI